VLFATHHARLPPGWTLALCMLAALAAPGSRPAWALDAQSPEVVAMLDKAVAYLRTGESNNSSRMALTGYTLLKYGIPKDDEYIQKIATRISSDRKAPVFADYDLCVYLMFLAELDPVKYRADIDRFLAELVALQRPFGGWTYAGNFMAGDTSQTQYAILALWQLEHAGIPTPDAAWLNACNWLLRTQDPGGGFGYQPVDPGSIGAQKPVPTVSNSLTAGGLGSLYICLDHFKGDAEPEAEESESENPSGLPTVFTPVGAAEKRKAKAEAKSRWSGVNDGAIRAAVSRGDEWFESNFRIDLPKYTYYYLYALERYYAFRDFAQGRESGEAQWYDDGARFLMAHQEARGSWNEHERVPDTCFAVLFLIRSARAALGNPEVALGSGQLIGGHGLPKNLSEITERAGRIRAKPLRGPAEDMLKVLADPDNPDHDGAIEAVGEFAAEADDSTLAKHAAQLRSLAKGKSPEARALAVRALARTRNLDDVPTLVLALSDADERVVREAHNGLRFVSRKLGTIGPDPPAAGPDRRLAIQGWKDWYLKIRPNAEFED
jgi:hypothetical protein